MVEGLSPWQSGFAALALRGGASVLEIAGKPDGALRDELSRWSPGCWYLSAELGAPAASVPRPAADALAILAAVPLQPNSYDLIALTQAIPRIVLDAVAEREGMAIERGQWQTRLPDLMRALRAYWRSGEVEEIAAPRVAAVVRACAGALRRQGAIVFSHHVDDEDLLLGHPLDLHTEYVPLIRSWVAASNVGLAEKRVEGMDPQWWLCLRGQ